MDVSEGLIPKLVNRPNTHPIITECAELSNSVHNELELYKQEQASLRTEMANLIEENRHLYEELKFAQNPNALISSPRHRKGTDMVANLQRQLALTVQEKESIQEMWQLSAKEVDNLEDEINSYKNNKHVDLAFKQLDEVKHDYSAAIRLLEDKLTTVSAEAEKERLSHDKTKHNLVTIRKDLQNALDNIQQRDAELQAALETTNSAITKIQDLEKIINVQREDLKSVRNSRDELERALEKCRQQMEHFLARDQVAHDKVEEALMLVEEAVSERDTALHLEAQVREENIRLQTQLADLIKEAGVRIKEEVEKLKNNYDRKLETVIHDMKHLEIVRAEKAGLVERLERERAQLMAELEMTKKEMEKPELHSVLEHKVNVAYRELTESERRNYQAAIEAESLREELQRLKESHAKVLERKQREWLKAEERFTRLQTELESALQAQADASSNVFRLQQHVVVMEDEVRRLRDKSSTKPKCGSECQNISKERAELFLQLQEIQKHGMESAGELQYNLECQQALKEEWQNTLKSMSDNFQLKIGDLRAKLRELKREKRELQEELNQARREINNSKNEGKIST